MTRDTKPLSNRVLKKRVLSQLHDRGTKDYMVPKRIVAVTQTMFADNNKIKPMQWWYTVECCGVL